MGGGGGGGGRCATTARWSCTQEVNQSADSYCTAGIRSYVEAVCTEPTAVIQKGYKHA